MKSTMKKIIIISMLLILSAASFSQPAPETPTLKTDYLKKSKSQKTAAWILLGTGTALMTTGFAVGVNEGEASIISLITGEVKEPSNTGETLIWTGLAAAAGSIPLFIAARKNNKKAMSLSLKNETMPQLHKGGFINQSVPSLTLKISL